MFISSGLLTFTCKLKVLYLNLAAFGLPCTWKSTYGAVNIKSKEWILAKQNSRLSAITPSIVMCFLIHSNLRRMFFSCVPIANFGRKCLKGRDTVLLNHQVFVVSSLCQEALARIAEGVWLPMAPKILVHHLVALQLLCHTDCPSALLTTGCHWWSMHLCWQHGLRVPSSSPSHSQAQDKKWCCWPSQLMLA